MSTKPIETISTPFELPKIIYDRPSEPESASVHWVRVEYEGTIYYQLDEDDLKALTFYLLDVNRYVKELIALVTAYEST